MQRLSVTHEHEQMKSINLNKFNFLHFGGVKIVKLNSASVSLIDHVSIEWKGNHQISVANAL